MRVNVNGVGYETDQHPEVLLDMASREFNFQNDYVVAVSGDLQSQLLTIKVPRYYDGIDLQPLTAKISYLSSWAGENKGYGEFTVSPTIDTDTDYLLYPWVLSADQTSQSGYVSFDIKWLKTSTAGEETYILRSLPGRFIVEQGLDLSSITPDYNTKEQIQAQITSLKEKLQLLENRS